MRTANEMLNYCIKNKYKQGRGKNFCFKLFSLIEQELETGEEVTVCFPGFHDYIPINKVQGNHYGYAFTDRRLIMVNLGFFTNIIKSINYEELKELTVVLGKYLGKVIVKTNDVSFKIIIDKKPAESIRETLLQMGVYNNERNFN